MRYSIRLSQQALRQLQKLEKNTARRIIDKLYFFEKTQNPLLCAKKLKDRRCGEYRFRIGEYRVIFDIENEKDLVIINILVIKHRKDVYSIDL